MRRERQRGQALAILAICMAVLLAATATIIDGGNAMAQQRGTQNAADSAALAGALTIAQKLGGASKTDSSVHAAMQNAFTNNGSTMATSYYVNYSNSTVGTVGTSGSIPGDAYGVLANGNRTFDTFFARVMGMNTMTSGATASALAGALRSICAADDGCAVMPVTFSIPITTCDGTSRPLRIGVDWPIVGLDIAKADTSGRHMSIVPLCKNGPGGVGWLDMSRVWQSGSWTSFPECGGTLKDQIQNQCNGSFDLPVWLKTSTGDVNSVDSYVNDYRDKMILIPMFDATCRDVPSTGLPADCTDPGDGTNLYYHIPRFAQFLLHRAYIQGDNSGVCNSAPGKPFIGGNGGTSCFKGWFVRYIMQGRVGGWDNCASSNVADCLEPILGIQLVR